MREVTLREANQNFSACVAEVEAGERLVLTRRGRPVAQLIPFREKAKPDPKQEAAWQEMLEIMKAGLDWGGPSTYDERHER